MPRRAAPRRTAPRRDAGQRSRGAGWCAVVLVRMHISVPHILIQGVITRLSSAHSHHCLNHPPPPSSTLHESSPVPLPPRPRVVLHLPHLHSHRRPPVALLRRPDHPIYPTRTFTTPPAGRIFLQTGPSLILAPLPCQLKRHASLVSLSLFPSFPPRFVLGTACVLAGGHVGGRACTFACIVVSRAPTRIIDTRLISIAASTLFLSDEGMPAELARRSFYRGLGTGRFLPLRFAS